MSDSWGQSLRLELPATEGARTQILQTPELASEALVSVALWRENGHNGVPLSFSLMPDVSQNADYPTINAGFRARVVARAGNASFAFRCDWTGGFAIPCRQITIEAESYAPILSLNMGVGIAYNAGTELSPRPFYRLTALAAPGGAGPRGRLTYTEPTVEVNAVQNEEIDRLAHFTVPPFARRFYPRVSRVPSATDLSAEEWDDLLRPEELEQIAIRLRTRGHGRYASFARFLSPELVTNGIDLGYAQTVAIEVPAASASAGSYGYRISGVFDLEL